MVDRQEYLRFLEFQKAQAMTVAPVGGIATQSFPVGVEPILPAPMFMSTPMAPLPDQGDAATTAGVVQGMVEIGEDGSDPEVSPVAALASTDSPFDDLATRDELARLLRVSGKTVERMAEDHRLPKGLDLGRKVWSKERVYAWIVRRMEKQDEETLAEMARLKIHS